MVELPEGKMKSREGTVVDADDLMEEMVSNAAEVSASLGKTDGLTTEEVAEIAETVGMGALKYFLLKVDPRKNMMFNPAESIDFNGNTGPFIQYTYARIRSVLRKAAEQGFAISDYSAVEPNEKEIALIQSLSDFPATVEEAGRTYSPALIANYTYELVKQYNQFYHDYSILKEENAAVRSLRLALCSSVARTVKMAMSLLGINVPERM
jgi:arginyl-tRNA synthetase